MDTDGMTLKLISEEALFLAALLGNEEFIGIDSPLFTISERDAKQEWNRIQIGLEEKQYIEVGFDGSVVVDEVVFGVINTCCRCDIYVLMTTLSKGTEFSEYHYYVTEYLAVEMAVDPDRKGEHSFEIIMDTGEFKRKINNNIILEKVGVSTIERVRVAEKQLEECKKIIDDGNFQDAVSLLVANGCNENAAREVLTLMNNPSNYMSLALVRFGEANSGNADKLVLLQNDKNTIKLETGITNGESYFDFIPVTYDEALNNILKMVTTVDIVYKYEREVVTT